MYFVRLALALFAFTLLLPASRAGAAERLCDSAFENCRTPLLTLINNEQIGIDVAFWFMEDLRYADALIARWNGGRGVPVRVIIDTEANAQYANEAALDALRQAGIPMIEKTSGGIVHWKMMLFAGQNVVQFSGANYSPHAFVPTQPYVDYLDEVIYFSDDPAIVNSFKRRYDDVWTTTTGYTPYANVSGTRTRNYATFTVDPQMNFPPFNDFALRSIGRYNAERESIDSIMFRITDRRHTDALIAAIGRGVPMRLITDVDEYRDPTRLWNSWNIDRLHAAGARVRFEGHLGHLHQKSTILHGQDMVIFGSSNWTGPSANSQLEHNIFTTKPLFYQWFTDQFERKWNNETGNQETMPFVPGPPDRPANVAPANAAQNQPLSVTLRWNAGLWAHVYDIYFGTTSNPPLLAENVELGPSETSTDYVTYAVTDLQPGTTYYWRIVSKTMANVTRNGDTWNFRTTGGTTPTAGPDDVVLYAGRASVRQGRWSIVSDSTAAGGSRMGTVNAGVQLTVSATPADYFEMTFNAAAGVPYRLWLRGKAEGNAWANDSAFVQFNNSVTSGAATFRIGTTSATTVTIEDCSGCGLAGWGWNDNAYGSGALGPLIYFATTGEQRIRVQMREDGLSIDQIVLSRGPFLNTAPGSTKNDGTIYQAQGGTTSGPGDPGTLPTGWQSRDIGAVGVAGSASASTGTFTVSGAGADIWGTSDAFHFAYRTLSGDGTVVARVASISGSQAWTKMGVMIRSSTAANAAYALMLVSTGKGLAFQRRTSDGVLATNTAGGSGTAPRWVRLQRTGNVITASVSTDGSAWTTVGSDTFSMPASVLVGLTGHSHTTSSLATGVYDNVTVSTGGAATTLPDGWSSQDIGTVGVAGSGSENGGTFTLRGAGDDIWGTSDEFHFIHRDLAGDGEIVARVASISGVDAWTKMGVMIRESDDPGAAFAFMLVSTGKGLAFQGRTAAGVAATSTAAGSGTAPRWVKLTRTGVIITAAVSSDGTAWTAVASDSFTMGDDVLVGLAGTSHDASRSATGTFDAVTVSSFDDTGS